ncbi:putative cytochrome P450 oxidoreductase [Poronia punctata]|nr:putative cytochrome P450 oxidoreductase [Poronia punctata]
MAIHLAPAAVYLALGFIIYTVGRLFQFIKSAKATGLPYVVVPFLETEIISQLLTPFLRNLYFTHLDKGEGWPRWCRFMIRDWSWEDKRRAYDEYGDVFLVVSPQGIICYCADAAMAFDVMNRRYDFTKPRDKYQPYGPNVFTAEGSTYSFHVRMVAPSFGDNTGVNELVWQETSRQTELLLDRWTKKTPKNLDTDINALTLAIISLAGFGKRLESVEEQEQDIPPGYRVSFLTALRNTTRFILPILLFPMWLLDFMPWYSEASLAKGQLDKYLRTLIQKERAKGGGEEQDNNNNNRTDLDLVSRANLLHAVVHAVEGEEGREHLQQTNKNGGGKGNGRRKEKKHGFTEDEVMGNLFIYMLAGYETTANSIQYGLLVLAANPDIQSKVTAEIDRVYDEAALEGRHALTYNEDFAKLEYTFGYMYETFRLYPGVVVITKMCTDAQKMQTDNDNMPQSFILPAGCRVYLSSPGTHYNPRYWEDPSELRPERWLTDKFPFSGPVVAADKTRQMRGTLLTFSDGARACLGRKFAQAEYMAFFATLLRRFEVGFAPGADVAKLKSDLDNKSAGKIVSLTPLSGFPLELKQRKVVVW